MDTVLVVEHEWEEDVHHFLETYNWEMVAQNPSNQTPHKLPINFVHLVLKKIYCSVLG